MMDHRDWVAHLKTNCPTLSGRVYDIAQFVIDAGGWKTLPAAYICPTSDTAQLNYASPASRQVLEGIVSVVLVVRASNLSGERQYETLASLRSAVLSALVGWQPTNAVGVVQFHSGASQEIVNNDLIWEDRYAVKYLSFP